MSDSAALPLHLGPSESGIEPMATEGGGLAATPAAERGRKRSPSPLTLSDDESDGDGEWLLSDSDDEDEDQEDKGKTQEDQEDKGRHRPFTVDDIPRPSCDHKQQTNVLYKTPETKVRGPLPIRLFPAFKSGEHIFGSEYNLADKSQISLDSVEDCPNECWCYPMGVLQFVDIKIASYRHTHPGQVKIYGFIAARVPENPLRNYIYCRGIENCESVPVKQKTGVARLSPTGPARVIPMFFFRSFIEFEIHARNEDEANADDDLIIEGCTEIDNFFKSKSFIDHRRFYGERCALDIKYIVMINAVEALVEVTALRLDTVPGGVVNMKLYAKTSGFNDVIPLFQGIAPGPGGMMRFTIGAERRKCLDLYIEGSRSDDATLCWQCGFYSGYHETNEVADLGLFAAFSVKVTWRSYKKKTWLMNKK